MEFHKDWKAGLVMSAVALPMIILAVYWITCRAKERNLLSHSFSPIYRKLPMRSTAVYGYTTTTVPWEGESEEQSIWDKTSPSVL